MIGHSDINDSDIRKMIRRGVLSFAGNTKLKIYGRFHCLSGKRMKKHNRVFFTNESEAIALSYRPCAHCMSEEYLSWKQNNSAAS